MTFTYLLRLEGRRPARGGYRTISWPASLDERPRLSLRRLCSLSLSLSHTFSECRFTTTSYPPQASSTSGVTCHPRPGHPRRDTLCGPSCMPHSTTGLQAQIHTLISPPVPRPGVPPSRVIWNSFLLLNTWGTSVGKEMVGEPRACLNPNQGKFSYFPSSP